MHINIQGIRDKLLDLEIFLQQYDRDVQVICICEHRLKSEEISTVCIPGFKLSGSFCRNRYIS